MVEIAADAILMMWKYWRVPTESQLFSEEKTTLDIRFLYESPSRELLIWQKKKAKNLCT